MNENVSSAAYGTMTRLFGKVKRNVTKRNEMKKKQQQKIINQGEIESDFMNREKP